MGYKRTLALLLSLAISLKRETVEASKGTNFLASWNKTDESEVSQVSTQDVPFLIQTSSTPNTTFVTSPSPWTASFVIPYHSRSLICQNVATYFVYEENLCGGAEDPATYLDSAKSVYTCADRCGQAPTSGSPLKECGCDARCLAHRDCCKDMSLVCPDIYAEGKSWYAHVNRESTCVSSRKYFFSCLATDVVPKRFAIKGTTSEPTLVNSTLQQQIPSRPRKLERFTRGFDYYLVADVSLGIIFFDYDRYDKCRLSTSYPYIIPSIATLSCTDDAFVNADDFSSATQILQWCQINQVDHVSTPFDRGCKVNQLLSCLCDDETIYYDHIHNACIGPNATVDELDLFTLWNYHSDYLRIPPSGVPCHTSKGEKHTTQVGFSTLEKTIKISVSPVPLFLSTTSLTNNRSSDENDKNLNRPKNVGELAVVIAETDAINSVQERNTQFVVEITNTLERRLLCDKLQNFLSDCKLLDCTHGAILLPRPLPLNEFEGFSCSVPKRAVITQTTSTSSHVSVCWCIQVLAALTDLAIWSVRMDLYDEGRCFLDMTPLLQAQDLEVYSLAQKLHWPATYTTNTPTIKSIENHIRTRLQNTTDCPNKDGKEGLRIYFYSTKRDTRDSTRDSARDSTGNSTRDTQDAFATITLFSTFQRRVINAGTFLRACQTLVGVMIGVLLFSITCVQF